jgi:hypothetical protein
MQMSHGAPRFVNGQDFIYELPGCNGQMRRHARCVYGPGKRRGKNSFSHKLLLVDCVVSFALD